MAQKKPAVPKTILLPVFAPAFILILILLIGTMNDPVAVGQVLADVLDYLTVHFGWFYMLAVAFFLLFMVAIALSKWGSIKLGRSEEHTSELQSRGQRVCRLLLEKKKNYIVS